MEPILRSQFGSRNRLVCSNFLGIYFSQSRGETLLYKAHLDVTYLKLRQSETDVRSFKPCKLKSTHVYFIPSTKFPTRFFNKAIGVRKGNLESNLEIKPVPEKEVQGK